MTTHLSLDCRDKDGAAISPDAARLIDDQAQAAVHFADDGARGYAARVDDLDAGDYELRVDLPDYPTLVFRVQLEGEADARSFKFRGTTPKCCTVASKRTRKDDAQSPVLITASFSLGAGYEELVLVAGWDYSGGSDNTAYAKTWRDDLYAGKTWVTGKKSSITRVIFDHTVVTLFDFESGDRIRWIKGQKGWHLMDTVLQGTVPTHTGKYSTDANRKKRHDDDAISVVHVYHHLIELGRHYAGSLVGFHMFSHSYIGGPILVNTDEDDEYDQGGAKQDERDPGDKDGRLKDFTATNMPDAAQFKAAFKSGAIAKVWGCFADREVRRMVRLAYDNRKKPDKELEFEYRGETFKKSAKEIVEAFEKAMLPKSYMGLMAKAAGVTVYGAPPGTGANLKSVGKRDYMFIDDSIYAKECKWFETVLKIKADESGHIPFK